MQNTNHKEREKVMKNVQYKDLPNTLELALKEYPFKFTNT